ncbi:MAG: BamA/TamA family outer membrane protein [Cyclobacteriaceae bacterium]|nr:BamA/TamA family outer membrane protein [Cyclobacteriaceae bacterium]
MFTGRFLIICCLGLCSFSAWSQADPKADTKIDEPIIPVEHKKQKRLVLFPVLVKSPEYSWGAGIAGTYFFNLWNDSTTRTSNIKNVSFYTLRRQLIIASDGTIYSPNEKYILHFIASFSHFPDRFWGLGNETPLENQENYSISQFDLYPQILRKVFSDFYLGVSYEFQNVYDFEYNADGTSLFDLENITGRKGGKISGAGILVTWDSRDNAFSPSKGFYAQYYLGDYNEKIGSDFNFTIHNLDMRTYFGFKKDRVLAFQLNIISTIGNTPIRDLASMGSSSYMRGYYEGRFTDRSMVAFQAEYRVPVKGRWGFTTFAGVGRVGSSLTDALRIENVKPSFGIGLRYALRPKEKLNLRVDAGFGQQSQGTYINIGESF